MHYYHLASRSRNSKTGDMVVVMASRSTCPVKCPFQAGGCYASQPPLRWHWDRLSEGSWGYPFPTLEEEIQRVIRPGRVVRYGDAGDLPGDGLRIDQKEVLSLAKAIKGAGGVGYCYTHYLASPNPCNIRAIDTLLSEGFTVNISTESDVAADKWASRGFPVVLVVREAKGHITPGGRKVCICTHARTGRPCTECGNGRPWCTRSDRQFIVGLPVHGLSCVRSAALKQLQKGV